MDVLLESNWPAILIGVVLLVIGGYVYLQTRHRAALIAMGIVVLLVGSAVGLQWSIVTPREEVEAVLTDAAADFRRDDIDGVLEHVEPEARQLRALITRYAGSFRGRPIVTFRVTRITMHPERKPPEASVRFHAVFVGPKDDNVRADENLGITRFCEAWRVDLVLRRDLDTKRWRATDQIDYRPTVSPPLRQ